MPRSLTKGRHVVSDHEMIMAMEIHIPSIRSIRHSLTPYSEAINSWESKDLEKMDKELSRGIKLTKLLVQEAFVKSSLRRIEASRAKPGEVTLGVDLFTLLEATWISNMAYKEAIDCINDYQMVYDNLTIRLAGRLPNSKELDNLHKAYGSFNQAIKKLGIALEKLKVSLETLSRGKGAVCQSVAFMKESIAKVTDVKDSLLILKDHHQRGFDIARGH